MGGGLIIEANIPVQELEGQRGEGAYFREDTVLLGQILGPALRNLHVLGCPTEKVEVHKINPSQYFQLGPP